MQRRMSRWVIGVLAALLVLPALPAAAQGLPTAEADIVYGQPDFTTTADLQLVGPIYVAVEEATNTLFVAEATGLPRVVRWQNASTVGSGAAPEVLVQKCADSSTTTANCLLSIEGMTLDDRGGLWVAGNGRMLYFPSAATAAPGRAATIVLGAPDFTTPGGRALFSPFFADGALHAFSAAALLSWPYSSLPANGAAPTEQSMPDITSTDAVGLGDPRQGGFWLSSPSGKIEYIPDSSDVTVRTGELGRGASDSGPAPSQTLPVVPVGLALDAQGTLFSADVAAGRVVGFFNAYDRALARKQGGDAVPADLLFGQSDWTAMGGSPEVAQSMIVPYHLAYDRVRARLYVTDPAKNRVLGIPYGEPLQQDEDEPAAPLRDCDVTPDLAVSPERIELAAGGTATLEIAMRNVGTTPHGYNDIVLSLSDGLRVVDAPGMRNLGQRAAVQIDEVGPNETIRLSVTVAADAALAVPPQFAVEQYCGSRVLQRIDGIFVGATVAAPAAAEAPAAPAAPAPVDVPLPAALPNTAGTAGDGWAGVITAIGLVVAGALLLLRRRTAQR